VSKGLKGIGGSLSQPEGIVKIAANKAIMKMKLMKRILDERWKDLKRKFQISSRPKDETNF
jgi:23S rRNA G2069 N7-methylase RlmK/C1962 C5-methylase RlmI